MTHGNPGFRQASWQRHTGVNMMDREKSFPHSPSIGKPRKSRHEETCVCCGSNEYLKVQIESRDQLEPECKETGKQRRRQHEQFCKKGEVIVLV